MSMLGNIFKTDSQKLTEAVTGLESLSSQFDELATSVAANAIDSDEFNFRGAAQAIANNISMAGQKVKASSSFITDVMNTQEDLQSSMVFKFEDYISEAETALEIKVTDGVNVTPSIPGVPIKESLSVSIVLLYTSVSIIFSSNIITHHFLDIR